MGKDKPSDILRKHLLADTQMKKTYFDENDPHTYANRITNLTATGAIFLQRGMYMEAAKCLLKAHCERIDDFWANYYLGSMALEANDPSGANYFFRACLEEAPEDWIARPTLLNNYASIQLKLGDFEGAESSLEEAIKLDPILDGPYYLSAIHKIYREQYDEASRLVQQGLKQSPKSTLLRHLELDLQEIMES